MGEYYLWANIDKYEYIAPCDFGYGCKMHESMHRDCELLAALKDLLSGEWSGCQIVWIGDYAFYPDADYNGLFTKVREQEKALPHDDTAVQDVIENLYTNVSGRFKSAEEVVTEEISCHLMELKRGNKNDRNTYGIDENDPYRGLFCRIGKNFEYVINYSKGVGYSKEKTNIYYSNGEKCDCLDPLPMLMGYGETIPAGKWLGDTIGVADELPNEIRLLERIGLDW